MIENRLKIYGNWLRGDVDDGTGIGPGPFGLTTSYGPSETGFDVRLAKDVAIVPWHAVLGVTREYTMMPTTHCAKLIGKSTLARVGIHLNVTEIDPGFHGHITVEITWIPLWQGWWALAKMLLKSKEVIPAGTAIGTIQWHELMAEADYGHRPGAKYHNDDDANPVAAR